MTSWKSGSALALLGVLEVFSVIAQDRRVALTIDDLPCANCAEGTWMEVTNKLLDTLDAHHVPAVGFVNEGKLHHDGALDTARLGLLEQWLQHGQELGNHTFGHRSANDLSVAGYEDEVRRGAELTRSLSMRYDKPYRYFRHPYLNAGATSLKRDSIDAMLLRNGYTIAPVTFDNDEYIFAYCYEFAKRANDTTAMRWIASEYLEHMGAIVGFYEQQSAEFLGREMAHILLLHANTLNADHLGTLLTRIEEGGYRYITLEEALKDGAYGLPESTMRYGFSWIRRWREAAGQTPPWPPEASPAIMERYDVLRKQHR